jgi:hypothetical protein
MSEEIFTYPDGTTITAEAGSPAAEYLAAMLNVNVGCSCDDLEICNDENPESEETE